MLMLLRSFNKYSWFLVKFLYSEKATKFCKIFPLLLTVCTVVSKGKISQNYEAFSEYMNFKGENDDIITLSMFAHMQSQGKYSLSGWIVAVCYRVDPSQQWTSLTNDYLSDKAKNSINLNQVLTLSCVSIERDFKCLCWNKNEQ